MKKQIVINVDERTHTFLKGVATRERRTLGNQVLALILPALPEDLKSSASKKKEAARA